MQLTASVDQVLRDHGLTPDTARRCIAGMLRYNQKNAAAKYEFDVATAKRYRDAFQAMDDEVFWTVVATIAHRRLNEISDRDELGDLVG